MYEAFYGLKEKPFSIQPDPEFLFMSKRHSLAYAMLEHGIMNRAGFCVISGEIGCGKTTLIRHLLNNLGSDILVGLVYNTHKETEDLLKWIMLSFGQPYEGFSRVELYDHFQNFLIDKYARGQRVVLIIDEAQNLTPETLEFLRMLSNINADKDQLLQMILVGQPQLKELLKRADLRQFAQRVSVDFFIRPLIGSEVEMYIRHRLGIAGRDTPLFSPEACERIATASGGIPRSINILCDMALVYGFSGEAEEIGLDIVEDVISDRNEFGLLGTLEA